MNRNKERYDAEYELWRMGEGEASANTIDNYLDSGYTGDEVASRIHQDRENIRAERAAEDQRIMYEEMEYSKYCEFAEEQERYYQEYIEEELAEGQEKK